MGVRVLVSVACADGTICVPVGFWALLRGFVTLQHK